MFGLQYPLGLSGPLLGLPWEAYSLHLGGHGAFLRPFGGLGPPSGRPGASICPFACAVCVCIPGTLQPYFVK